MKISEDIKLDFDDVLIRPKRSTIESRKDVNLIRVFKPKYTNQVLSGCGIIASNMYNIGSIECARVLDSLSMFTALHKFYSVDEIVAFLNENNGKYQQRTFITIGEDDSELSKLKLIKERLNTYNYFNICYDVANAYRERAIRFVGKIRETFPSSIIMAGNVCTPDITEQLILAGASIIKVGIGGSVSCETRTVTACGFPQLSAILDTKDAAHGLGSLICSDGGCKTYGDICKSFGAGSDFTMIGNLLGGTDTNIGEWEYEYELKENYQSLGYHQNMMVYCNKTNNKNTYDVLEACNLFKKRIKFYGMSSREAQDKHNGGFKDYRAPEGNCRWVDYKGKTEDIIKEIQGAIRSCCSYIGARRIKDMDKCASFIKVNRIK